MKKLLIIVPKGSALDSYLADAGFIYDEIERLSHTICYTINLTDKMDFINFLISKFSPQDYFIVNNTGEFIFCVHN